MADSRAPLRCAAGSRLRVGGSGLKPGAAGLELARDWRYRAHFNVPWRMDGISCLMQSNRRQACDAVPPTQTLVRTTGGRPHPDRNFALAIDPV